MADCTPHCVFMPMVSPFGLGLNRNRSESRPWNRFWPIPPVVFGLSVSGLSSSDMVPSRNSTSIIREAQANRTRPSLSQSWIRSTQFLHTTPPSPQHRFACLHPPTSPPQAKNGRLLLLRLGRRPLWRPGHHHGPGGHGPQVSQSIQGGRSINPLILARPSGRHHTT